MSSSPGGNSPVTSPDFASSAVPEPFFGQTFSMDFECVCCWVQLCFLVFPLSITNEFRHRNSFDIALFFSFES